jgi:hypothetical protein
MTRTGPGHSGNGECEYRGGWYDLIARLAEGVYIRAYPVRQRNCVAGEDNCDKRKDDTRPQANEAQIRDHSCTGFG